MRQGVTAGAFGSSPKPLDLVGRERVTEDGRWTEEDGRRRKKAEEGGRRREKTEEDGRG
jgi:hypothetical protein